MTNNEFLTTLLSRRSIRAFTDRAIDRADLEAIVEAGKCAPSGRNRHSRRLTVITDPAKIAALAKVLGTELGNDAANIFNGNEGLYKLQMNADGKIIAVDLQNGSDGWARKYAASDVTDDDTVVVLSDGKAVNIAGAKIWAVEVDETVDPLTSASWTDAFRVSAAELSDIVSGYKVFYNLVSGTDYVVDTMFVFVPVEE